MDFGIYAGDANKTIYVRLRDSTTGLAKTGLVYNSAGAVCSYTLPLAARAAVTLATQTVTGAHSDGGFVEVDATNCKGLYRLDLPDAAIASGDFTVISIEFDGIIEESILIPLHTRNVNVIEWLGTAAATPTVAGVPEVDLTHVGGATTNVAALATNTDAIKTKTDYLPSATAGAAGGVFIAGTNAATTITTGLTTTFTGNLTGSVGSVTGNVDGNVSGTVASVVTKTGYELSATGADLILKTSTFALAMADAIWDETLAGHVTADTAGLLLNDWQDGGRLDLILDARMAEASISTTGGAIDLVTTTTTTTTATNLTNLPTIPTNWLTADGLHTDAVAEIVDGVWDEDVDTSHQTAGTAGKKLDDAGAAADPWSTALPGAYGAGTAGFILGTNLDAVLTARTLDTASYFDPAADTVANVTTVATTTNLTNLPSIPANWLTAAGIAASALDGKGDWNVGKTGYSLSASGVDDIWDETLAGHVTADTAGLVLNEWQDGGRLDLILDARMAEASINTTAGAVDTVTTLTGHTAQTGDSYALANGATGFAAIDTVVDGIQTDLDNATDGLGALKALIDTADTVVDAIKVTTDKITFTVANQVDSNLQSINDVTVTGTGVSGDEWGP